MQMDDITMLALKVIVSICAALITAYVLPYLKTLKDDKRYAMLFDMVALAVRAAEQTITESGQGKVKKAKVIKFLTEWLGGKGIIVSDDDLSDLIEAAVYQMHKED